MEKYITNPQNLKETLNTFGVAIIPNVLNEQECEHIVSGLWDYFEHLTQTWDVPIDRNNQSTWKEIYKLFPLHSMLFQYFSIGHAQVCWDVRQNPKIVNIFAELWKCKPEDLLSSFDGVGFNMPPEITKRGWNLENTWYHTDQSFTRNDLECIQAWVTGLDVEEGDATLGVMEGSHKFREECAKKFNLTDKADWHKLTKEEEQFFVDKGCSYVRMTCPKGSLVFWDSRTIHCGVEANKGRANPKLRAVIYTCYTPRKLIKESDLKKKIKAFEELRTTNHWPHKPKLFGKMPRTYGNTIPDLTLIGNPVVNNLGRRLIGYN